MDELNRTPAPEEPVTDAPVARSDRNGYVYATALPPVVPPTLAAPFVPASTPCESALATQENERALRRTLSWLAAGTLLMLLGWVVTLNVLSYFTGQYWTPILSLFFNDLCLYGVGAPLFILCAFRVRPEPTPKHAMRFGSWLAAFLISVFFVQSVSTVSSGAIEFITRLIGWNASDRIQDLGDGVPLWLFVVLFVVAGPIGEEFFFRRCLCDRLRPFGEKTAVVISAFIFGLFHINYYQFGYATALGLVLAYVYLRTGRLRYCVAIHGGVNLVLGLFPEIVSRYVDFDWIDRVSASLQNGSFDAGVLQNVPWGSVALYAFYLLLTNALVIAGLVFFILRMRRLHWETASRALPFGRVALRLVTNPFVWIYVAHALLLAVLYLIPA